MDSDNDLGGGNKMTIDEIRIYLRGFNTAREQAVGIVESLKLEQKGYTEGVYNQAFTTAIQFLQVMLPEVKGERTVRVD